MGIDLIEEIKEFYIFEENKGVSFVKGDTHIDYKDALDILRLARISERLRSELEDCKVVNELLIEKVKVLRIENDALKSN